VSTNDEGLEPRPGTVVQSVDRALSIMEILARDDWSGVTEIAKELGIHKSTVFRLVSTLERRGFVEQHTSTQKYRLGFAIMRLAAGVRSALDLVQVARPICERLSEWAGETVNLAVLEGGEVVNVDQVNLSSSTVSVNWIGRRSALHATSTGKVFLAHASERTLEAYIGRGLRAVTERTITDADELRKHLAEVRDRGYAEALEELEVGLHAIAAPVYAHDDTVIAAVGVSGPSYRLVVERLDEVGRLTADSGVEISRGLGYLGEAAGTASSG
jgi:IclR family transcriptional regulator, acetate operon repressor